MDHTRLEEMIDGGEDGANPQSSRCNHHPLERVGRKYGDDVTAPAAETQQMARRQLHAGVEFPERHRFPQRHVHLKL